MASAADDVSLTCGSRIRGGAVGVRLQIRRHCSLSPGPGPQDRRNRSLSGPIATSSRGHSSGPAPVGTAAARPPGMQRPQPQCRGTHHEAVEADEAGGVLPEAEAQRVQPPHHRQQQEVLPEPCTPPAALTLNLKRRSLGAAVRHQVCGQLPQPHPLPETLHCGQVYMPGCSN